MSTMPVNTHFPEFVPNQILTNTQLNDLREYLDEQNRLTRVRLTGTGIICGLHATVDRSGADPVIRLTEGFGITSEGYLLEIPATQLVAIADYLDPDRDSYVLKNNPDDEDEVGLEVLGPRYEPWRLERDEINPGVPSGLPDDPPGNPVTQIPVSELLTQEAADEHDTARTLVEADWAGQVLVLYLEIQKHDLKSCLTTDCNNKGQNLEYVVKALLVPEDQLTPVTPCTHWADPVFVPRFHRALRQNGIGGLENIDAEADINATYGKIVRDLKVPLGQKIQDRYAEINPFLQLNFDMAAVLTAWDAALPDGGGLQQFHQYHYDFVRDLAFAYNEFVAHYCRIIDDCCPELDFPRHLMIRDFTDAAEPYRHEFRPSPVRNVQHHDLQKTGLLFVRLLEMIRHFDPSLAEGIKITPSHHDRYPLGEKAIPHYYDLTDGVLQELWPAEPCCRDPRILSYAGHGVNAADPDNNDIDLQAYLNTPLESLIDKKSFFRIEGHLGSTAEQALQEIRHLRQTHNLDFELKLLQLQDDDQGLWTETTQITLIKEALQSVDKIRRQIEQQLTSGKSSDEALQPLREKLKESWTHITSLNDSWVDDRLNHRIHCDLSHLRSDYLLLRSRVLCTYAKIKKALDELPDLPDSPAGQSACVTFEELEADQRFGREFGHEPGQLIFEENGIGVSLQNFIGGTGNPAFNSVEVRPGLLGSGQAVFINNINLHFDFTKLDFTPTMVTFQYRDSGGSENIAVNGQDIIRGEIVQFPADIAPGVTLSIAASGNTGTVTLTGNIQTLTIGGQELALDTVCAQTDKAGFVGPSFKAVSNRLTTVNARSTELKANLTNTSLAPDKRKEFEIELSKLEAERLKLVRLENGFKIGNNIADKMNARILLTGGRVERAAFTPMEDDNFGQMVLKGLLLGLLNLKEEVALLCDQLPKDLKRFNFCLFIYHYKNVVASVIQLKLLASVLLDFMFLTLGQIQVVHRAFQLYALQWVMSRLPQITDYINCVNRMQYNCFHAEFATVYYTLEHLLRTDREPFGEFAARHPGMEHLAGVERGNTFLLVCEQEGNQSTIVADFTLNTAACCCCDLQPDDLCLPPVAMPDYKVIYLEEDQDPSQNLPLEAMIDVLSNDVNLNETTTPQISLPSAKSLLNQQNNGPDNLSIFKDEQGDAKIRYVRQSQLTAIDSFSYRLEDPQCGLSDEGEVLVLIRPASRRPIVAQEDLAATSKGQPIDIDVALNDIGEGFLFDDPYTLALPQNTGAFGGSITIKTATINNLTRQVFTYTPPEDYVGRDSFLYEIQSGGRKSLGQVTVLIVPCCEESEEGGIIVTGPILVGRVVDATGVPVLGATLTVVGTTRGAITNAQGRFSINLPNGQQQLQFSAAGFKSKTFQLRVRPNSPSANLEVILQAGGGSGIGGLVAAGDLVNFAGLVFTGQPAGREDPNRVVMDTFAIRHAERLKTLVNLRDDEVVADTEAFRRAENFLANSMIDADTSPKAIAREYKAVTKALIDAHKLSSGATKAAYKTLLENTTHAYMDKMIIKNPGEAQPEMKAELENTTAKLKAEGISVVGFKQRFGGTKLKETIKVGAIKDINRILS